MSSNSRSTSTLAPNSRSSSRNSVSSAPIPSAAMPASEDAASLVREKSRPDETSTPEEKEPSSPDVEKSPSPSRPQSSHDSFEVSFSSDTDPDCPRSMGVARKWLLVLILSGTSTCVTCTSSLYTATYAQLMAEFGTSEIVATVGLSLFVMGLGLGPMLLAPLSEFYGRRPVYILSTLLFIVWILPCAVARNTETILVARFINGFAGSAFLSVAGGTVGDLFGKSELHAPMMVYTASPFLGPEVGPILGGFINQFTSWRWSFYVLLVWSGVQFALICTLVPETYHPVVLRNKARRMREQTGEEKWHAPIEKMERSIAQTVLRSTYRPFLLLTLEPMCLNLCIFSALILGVVYLFFGAFEIVFKNNHGFEPWQIGLTFVGLLSGMFAGMATDPWWHKYYLHLIDQREQQGREPGSSEPEFRLPPAIAGSFLVTIGLFWFGWTTYSSIHWIVPIIGSAFFGAGVILVFSGIFTFLVDAYPLYAASALAANSFARSSFAAAFPLFGPAMYNNLGYQWATSLLAFLTMVMAPFPYIFFKYGKRIRAGSKFASAR